MGSRTRRPDLHRLLARRGSYAAIETAAASGALGAILPAAPIAHIGDVYRRVETAAGGEVAGIEALRLTALLHEEAPGRLAGVLEGAGLAHLAPIVLAVIGGFGKLWKASTEREVAHLVEAYRPHLAPLLLFELAHEGGATSQMERAAALGGLDVAFRGWVARLAAAARPPRIRMRRARPEDSAALTAIAHAAKRYWGYPEALIRLWEADLTVTPAFVGRHAVRCAVEGARPVGFYAYSRRSAAVELEHMWVDPERIGRGIGRRLFRHLMRELRALGATRLVIASDPHAEGFYTKMGARRVAVIASRPAGRTVPLFEVRVPLVGGGRRLHAGP